jgi:hypothetical protein
MELTIPFTCMSQLLERTYEILNGPLGLDQQIAQLRQQFVN